MEKEILIGKTIFDLSWKMLEPTNYETDYNLFLKLKNHWHCTHQLMSYHHSLTDTGKMVVPSGT